MWGNIKYSPQTIGKSAYQAKACADTDCTVFVLSNLVTLTTYCIGSNTLPSINNIHPISDNFLTPWTLFTDVGLSACGLSTIAISDYKT